MAISERSLGVTEDVKTQISDQALSKLLWDARETVEMYADIMEAQQAGSGMVDGLRKQVEEIDAYRAARGWNPHGFGGES